MLFCLLSLLVLSVIACLCAKPPYVLYPFRPKRAWAFKAAYVLRTHYVLENLMFSKHGPSGTSALNIGKFLHIYENVI